MEKIEKEIKEARTMIFYNNDPYKIELHLIIFIN